jgi:hypothetical protein
MLGQSGSANKVFCATWSSLLFIKVTTITARLPAPRNAISSESSTSTTMAFCPYSPITGGLSIQYSKAKAQLTDTNSRFGSDDITGRSTTP